METKLVDTVGTELYVNDYIAYAVRVGNSASLKIGRITKLDGEKIRCISAEHIWRRRGTTVKSAFKRQSKESTLDSFQRIIKIAPESLPEELLKELA